MKALSNRMIKKYNYLCEIRQRLETDSFCGRDFEEAAKNLKASLTSLSEFFKHNPKFYKSCTEDIDSDLKFLSRDLIIYLNYNITKDIISEISFSDAKYLKNTATKINDESVVVDLDVTMYDTKNQALGLIEIDGEKYYSKYMAVRNSLWSIARRWYHEVDYLISKE